MLASDQIITASPCSHPRLFFSIRGGGGGTYCVVVETTVKSFPSMPVSAIQLSIVLLNATGVTAFIDVLSTLYAAYLDLASKGFGGYGSWSISSPTPLIEKYTGSYTAARFTQLYAIFDTPSTRAESFFLSFKKQQSAFNASLHVSTLVSYFPTHAAYYETLSNVSSPIGQSAALGSRLLDRDALTRKRSTLSETLRILAGSPEQFTSKNIVFVGGGAVASNDDPWSGVSPVWRTSYVHNSRCCVILRYHVYAVF